jgi:hypothetical protein
MYIFKLIYHFCGNLKYFFKYNFNNLYFDGIEKEYFLKCNKVYGFDSLFIPLKLKTKDDIYNSYPLSGESALAKATMLNMPMIPEYAAYKSDISISDSSLVDTRWEPSLEAVNLELWKYNPKLFAKNGIVDPISLALCFENNADERIESSIEEYLEGYKW